MEQEEGPTDESQEQVKYKARACDWAIEKEGGTESFRETKGDRRKRRERRQRRWRKKT